MHIRPERLDDEKAIFVLVERAFASAPHRNGCEQFIVSALRKAGALTVSLVVEQAGRLVGHVAFSPVSLTDGSANWYGLGPVAVEPAVQRIGVGSALIRAGLNHLRDIGATGCVVLGEPSYYKRFGFKQLVALRYPGPPPEYFLAQTFNDAQAYGEVSYHASFMADA